jgi:hypothetical protein
LGILNFLTVHTPNSTKRTLLSSVKDVHRETIVGTSINSTRMYAWGPLRSTLLFGKLFFFFDMSTQGKGEGGCMPKDHLEVRCFLENSWIILGCTLQLSDCWINSIKRMSKEYRMYATFQNNL